MAKYGLAIGIDVDLAGLKKAGQQAAATLEGIRGQFGRMQNLVGAAMASPLFQAIGAFYQANAEARKTLDEMAKPFSTRMIEAEINAMQAKMAAGQRFVQLGMDEPGARRIERGAQQEIATALRAESPSGTQAKNIESFFTDPGAYIGNAVYGLTASAEASLMKAKELTVGLSDIEALRAQEAEIRAQSGLAMATGDTGQLEGLNLQLLRVLEAIKQNTERTR